MRRPPSACPSEEPGLVDDQHGVGFAKRLDDVIPQVVADQLGIPVGSAHHVLDAVGVGVADMLGDLPSVFPLDRPEKADQVSPGTIASLATGEANPDPSGHFIELLLPLADVFDADDGAGVGHDDPP